VHSCPSRRAAAPRKLGVLREARGRWAALGEICLADTKQVTDAELASHDCLEAVDKVPGDPETTAFKRRARFHQALWRQAHRLPEGSQPMRPRKGQSSRPIGSRIEVDSARERGSNFLTDAARDAVHWRVSHPEHNQTLDVDRLYADLLSSMPMCFNLFGPIAGDSDLATAAVGTWWPDAPGRVRAVRFEWSPGRRVRGRFLENRSAFDVAFELDLEDGSLGVVGVETKYHEDCKGEKPPAEKRLRRYEYVTRESRVFVPEALDALVGTHLQEIWLDHLLALSMLQHVPRRWTWAKFVLVHPAENPSYARAAAAYSQLLVDPSTFEVRTIESLLDGGVLPGDVVSVFRERYLS